VDTRQVLLAPTIEGWDRLTGNAHGHVAVVSGLTYEQPYVYLVAHVVEMWAAGWTDADLDALAAVSGASALFGYQPSEFAPGASTGGREWTTTGSWLRD